MLLTVSGQSSAQTSTQCLTHLAWWEARGEPVKAQAAVIQVARNRAKKWKMKICDVVKQNGQFSWYNKGHSFKVTQVMLENYFAAMKHMPVLDDTYLYFNDTQRLSYGKKHARKIGNMYFS